MKKFVGKTLCFDLHKSVHKSDRMILNRFNYYVMSFDQYYELWLKEAKWVLVLHRA